MPSFPEFRQLNIACAKSHQHEFWRFATNSEGKKVWATSLESQYPRKMRIALVQTVLQRAHQQGLVLQAQSMKGIQLHPLLKAQAAQISSGLQPRKKVPQLVPEFTTTAVFQTDALSRIPCSLLQKLPRPIMLETRDGVTVQVPQAARFLRFSPLSQIKGVGMNAAERGGASEKFQVVFGSPWGYNSFIQQACKQAIFC